MPDIDYYKALGVEAPEDAGSQPGAEPEKVEAENDAPENPVEEVAEESTEEPVTETEESEEPAQDGEPAVDEPQKRKQSKKENAKFAAARRKAEMDEAIRRAVQAERERAKAEQDALIAGAHLDNPYTGEPVRTREEFDAWQARHREEQRKEMQARAGLTDEEMAEFVSHLPEVEQAREARQRAEQVLDQTRQERTAALIDSELAKIREYDASVQSLDDIEKTAENPQILDMVQRGYSLSDAWLLTHYSEVIKAQTQAARQAAVATARSKDHLSATKSRGTTGMESVPHDVCEMYKIMNPGISDDEIIKDYNRYLRK